MTEPTFRRAVEADLAAIIALLADDALGASREVVSPHPAPSYRRAFAEIDADPNQFLCVAEDDSGIVGTLQVTLIPCLSRQGAKRGLIESVRVARHRRSQRIGEAMVGWAVEYCRAHACVLVQLTTDRSRSDAHRFYERLGFEGTHLGYKLTL